MSDSSDVRFLKDDSKEHWNLEGASRNTTRLMMEDMAAQPRDLLLHIGTPRRRSSSRLALGGPCCRSRPPALLFWFSVHR